MIRSCLQILLLIAAATAAAEISYPPPPYEQISPPDGLDGASLGQWFADRALICHHYYHNFHCYPDIENPKTFSEKIQYRMLYDRRPILELFADKIKVRDYVAERIGPKYLTTICQVAGTPDHIDWSNLPASCFVKTNHGSSMNVFVKWNTIDYDPKFLAGTKGILRRWLRTNYADFCGEWCYRNISPRLVYIEEDLSDNEERVVDWKFHVFDGKALYVFVHQNSRCNVYDRNLTLVDVRQRQANFDEPMIFPNNIDEMFAIADRLGEGLDYVRVDLYNIDGKIVFGELTNYPHAGLIPFDPPEFDRQLGDHWNLPRWR